MHGPILNHVKKYIDPQPSDLDCFTSKLKKVTVTKGGLILQPGTQVHHEYFVLKGCIKAYYIDAKGNSNIIQFAIENWWVGDFDAFYNQTPSQLHIEAIEDSTLLAISYSNLQTLFEEAPIFERYFRVLVTGAFISLRKRIISSLGKNAKERYIEFCESYPNIEDRVPNYQIANYLGISAESMSRVRRQIKKLKIS